MARVDGRRSAWAFAPAHITGIFSPSLANRDPRGRGSVGAGLVLDAGVHAWAEWKPASRSSLTLESDLSSPLPISRDVASRLLARRPGALRVRLRHDLPVGQGFGMSAAGALATALATSGALNLPRQLAIETAHLADLFGAGGLGGVPAILGGGLEVRTHPGVPPWGRIRHTRCDGTVFLVITGAPLPSPRLLRSTRFLRRVRTSAGPGLQRLGPRPSLRRFLAESERFTDSLRVGPAEVLRRVRQFRSAETPAAQTMFGQCLFVLPLTHQGRTRLETDLQGAGLTTVEIPISSHGAMSGRGMEPD